MKPGPELDELISVHVFGQTMKQAGWLKRYSAEMNPAIEVLEKIGFRGGIQGTPWVFEFPEPFKKPITITNAESMPHAICLAALKAVELESSLNQRGDPWKKRSLRSQNPKPS